MKKRRVFLKSILLFAALLLQYSVMQKITVLSFGANLCILALCGVCFFASAGEAAAFGAVFGIFVDAAAGRSFGVNALLFMYLAVGVKILASEKITNSPAIMAAYTWLFTFLYYLAYGLLSFAVLRGGIGIGRWLLTALVTAVLNFVLALPIFWLVERRQRRAEV